jgi:hypothetical protein
MTDRFATDIDLPDYPPPTVRANGLSSPC